MTLRKIFSNKWFALFILLMATILSPLDFYIVNLALPAIGKSLEANNSQLQMIISFYTCAYAVFQISGARIGDIFGRKRVFLFGLLGFILSSVVCGLAISTTMMIIGRILQGVFGAIMIPQVLAILHVIFQDKQKTKVMALYSFTFGLAAAFGQYLGAVLIQWNLFNLGWRIIFLINLPIGLFAFMAGLFTLPKSEINQGVSSIDSLGSIVLVVGLIIGIYPLVTLSNTGFTLTCAMYFILSIMLLVLFVKLQRKRKQQERSVLIDLSVFKYSNLKYGIIVCFLYYCSGVFYLAFGIYLQEELGWGTIEAGKAIIPFGIGFLCSSLVSSHLNTYFKSKALIIGLCTYALGFALMLFNLYCFSSVLLRISLLIIGCGMGLTLASVVRLSLKGVPSAFAGLASGLINSALQIGSAFGVAAIGSVFFIVAYKSDYSHAFGIVLLVLTVLQLIAIGFSMLIKEK